MNIFFHKSLPLVFLRKEFVIMSQKRHTPTTANHTSFYT